MLLKASTIGSLVAGGARHDIRQVTRARLMTRVTVAPDHGGNTLCPNCRTWGTHMFRTVASIESVTRSFLATLGVALIAMLVGGGYRCQRCGHPDLLDLAQHAWSRSGRHVPHRACSAANRRRRAVVARYRRLAGVLLALQPGPFIWPVVFILAVGLIASGTRQDTRADHAWLLLLPRFIVGWAFLDNAQNDYTWALTGGTF